MSIRVRSLENRVNGTREHSHEASRLRTQEDCILKLLLTRGICSFF